PARALRGRPARGRSGQVGRRRERARGRAAGGRHRDLLRHGPLLLHSLLDAVLRAVGGDPRGLRRRHGARTSMSARPTLSVILITRDEARRIERCLRSVDFADEVVVLDSGSTDETVALARELGARVAVRADWPGFGRQKNRALEL